MTGRTGLGILALGLVLAIAIGFGFTATQTSAGADVAVTIDSATMGVGTQADLDVNILNVGEPGLGAWSIDIFYDPAVVSAVSCAAEQGGVCNAAFAPNTVRFTGASAGGLLGTTKLAEIRFSCDTEGLSPLTLSIEVLADATIGAPQPLTASVQNGTVACGTTAPTATPPSGSDGACDAFDFQEDAQQALISDPSDPADLDPDNDGIACENLPSRLPPVDCDDFDTQQEAQAVYNADPADPFGLDADGDGVACEDLPTGVPSAGTGPGDIGFGAGSVQVWLIAGLIGAGIAWLSTGVAGAGLAFVGGGSAKNPKRETRPTASSGPFSAKNEVLTPQENSFTPKMRPAGSQWLSSARKRISGAPIDAPGFQPRRN